MECRELRDIEMGDNVQDVVFFCVRIISVYLARDFPVPRFLDGRLASGAYFGSMIRALLARPRVTIPSSFSFPSSDSDSSWPSLVSSKSSFLIVIISTVVMADNTETERLSRASVTRVCEEAWDVDLLREWDEEWGVRSIEGGLDALDSDESDVRDGRGDRRGAFRFRGGGVSRTGSVFSLSGLERS